MPSFDRPHDSDIPPSPWVMRVTNLVRPGGKVLDVAAGHGRHSYYFLLRGCSIVAADIDVSGLSGLADTQSAEIMEADLEDSAWPFTPGAFDAIVVTNYLHRPHFPHFIESLSPGGVLIIETFGQGNEKFGRPRNPDFLLEPGELLTAFSGTLQIIAYEHGVEHGPRPAVRQRLCAVKSSEPVSFKTVVSTDRRNTLS